MVPRKSRSPSACTLPASTGMPSEVATARSVTPAQATSASSSMSPEQSREPSPPEAGCSPASAKERPVFTEQETPFAQVAACREGHQGGRRLLPVALLQRRLDRPQLIALHPRRLTRRSVATCRHFAMGRRAPVGAESRVSAPVSRRMRERSGAAEDHRISSGAQASGCVACNPAICAGAAAAT